MKIEIWSDFMCPFCYIGKRRFDHALEQFANKNEVEIVWKSFLLSPGVETDPSKNANQFLAGHKGISLEEATALNNQVTQMAAGAGLTYNLDKAIAANTFNAHRFSHFARAHGRQAEVEEKLFAAYFTEGRNIDDAQTHIAIAQETGLDVPALANAMARGAYTESVMADIEEAQQLGIRAVPFFVFSRKYAVSGAQDTSVFLEALEKGFRSQ